MDLMSLSPNGVSGNKTSPGFSISGSMGNGVGSTGLGISGQSGQNVGGTAALGIGQTSGQQSAGTAYFNAAPSNAAIAGNQSMLNNNDALLAAQQKQTAIDQQILAQEIANEPGIASTLNLNAINAQTQAQAQQQVNPLYTQYLNQYNQQLAANEASAQQQNANNVQGVQNTLSNTLAQNTQAQTYAGQQNAATQGNINAQAQNYQLQSGNAQTAKVASIQGQLGSGNLSASGLGGQQLWQAENARNIADAAQQGQFQYQRNTSNLSTQDTFAQLAQSSLYAQQGATTQQNALNFNLSDYLRQAAYNDTQYQEQLAGWQQSATDATAWNLEGQTIQNQIQGLGLSGKNFAATEQAYSPYMSKMSAVAAPDQNSYLANFNGSTI
jgi:hypothetical protein